MTDMTEFDQNETVFDQNETVIRFLNSCYSTADIKHYNVYTS